MSSSLVSGTSVVCQCYTKENWHSRYSAYPTIWECSEMPALATLAQLVEQRTFNAEVMGSSPISRTNARFYGDFQA